MIKEVDQEKLSVGNVGNGSKWGRTGSFIEISSIRDVLGLIPEVESTN